MSTVKCMLKEAKTRRVILSVIAVMSLLAAFTVFFVLERPGVTMTDDTLPEYLSVSESGAVTVIVPADEEPKYTESFYQPNYDAEANNCKFKIYENGVVYFYPQNPDKPYKIVSYEGYLYSNHFDENVTAIKVADGCTEIRLANSSYTRYTKNLIAVDLSECKTPLSLYDKVFQDCHSLNYVNFGENSSITSIGTQAFYNCTALEQFPFEQLPNVTTIGNNAIIIVRELIQII